MASLLCQLHFWTLKALSPGSATEVGIHSYHDKVASSASKTEDGATECRRSWAEGRGITWTPRNRKPERLRDMLKECEELISSHTPVCLQWRSLRHCVVLLNNGTLITFTVSRHSGDLERVMVDLSLVGRLHSRIDCAMIIDSSIVLTLSEDKRPVCLSLGRRSGTTPASLTLTPSDSGRRLEKLSSLDPKFTFLDIKGMPSGLVQRRMTCNVQHTLVVVWWRDEQEGGWLWSSMAGSGPYNLVVFRVVNGKLEHVCGAQTDNDPVSVQFSKNRSHILYTLEKLDGPYYESCIYEYGDMKLTKALSEAKISCSGTVLVCERNKSESQLLLGCDDGTLILHNCGPGGPIKKTKALFSPISLIDWHPAGSFAVVGSPRGELQCLDLSLNPLLFQLLSEEPSPSVILPLGIHMMAPARLELTGWGSEPRDGEGHGGCYDNFIMVFNRGPVVVLRLELGVLSRGRMGPVEIVSEYISHKQLKEAVAFLTNLSWNVQPKDCFACLSLAMGHLLTLPLSPTTEALMNRALGTYLEPQRLLTQQVQNSYQQHIYNLARRLFHLLLRYQQLEKAFQLARDIDARDLFMDLHFAYLDQGDPKLAEAALRTAESIPVEDPIIGIFGGTVVPPY